MTRERPEVAAGRRARRGVLRPGGERPGALVELERLKRLAPDDFRPWHLAGRMYADFERYDEAIPKLRRSPPPQPAARAGGRNPRLPGRVLHRHARSEEALTLLESSPETLPVLMRRAEAWLELGQIPEARRAAEAARRLDGESCPVLSLAARAAPRKRRDGRGGPPSSKTSSDAVPARIPRPLPAGPGVSPARPGKGRGRELQAYEESRNSTAPSRTSTRRRSRSRGTPPCGGSLAALRAPAGETELAEVWERAGAKRLGAAGR